MVIFTMYNKNSWYTVIYIYSNKNFVRGSSYWFICNTKISNETSIPYIVVQLINISFTYCSIPNQTDLLFYLPKKA